LSLGWQSARPHVLATLGRAHTPGRAAAAVGWARAAGFPSVSLDRVYGAPGETPADGAATVEAALAAQPDHVSAYALTVEAGTPLAARMARGELPRPDDDDLADKYEWADTRLAAAGRPWYEISNWARPGHACRHNLAYWRSADWWGLGAGAHSHVGGLRWWNCRHPAAYAEALAAGRSPAAGREQLTERQRRWETVMLTLRLAEGLAAAVLDGPQLARAERWAADGLAEFDGSGPGRRLRLTRRGRLLADRVAADLVD
jgi:oxygen-independent coproporphyrinogen-3 oxidase